jgi:4-aminobutyrate aminotransferase-like enzyme
LACAAALATIEIIEREGLLARARAQLLMLEDLAAKAPIAAVRELRGLGAMIAIQIGAREDQAATVLAGRLRREHGILVTICGGHSVRLLLPYRAGRAVFEQIWRALRVCLEVPA